MSKTISEDANRQLKKDMQILRRGITPDALAVLERRYGFAMPLFGNDVFTSPESNDRFMRTALIKEGQRQIISFIRLSHSTENE